MTTSTDATNDRVAEALAQLEEAITAVVNGDTFRDWLELLSRLHSYSWSNTFLIQMQRPDATMVAGYRRWQDLGRQVRKGERGIRILAPVARRVKVVEIDDDGNEVERTRATKARRFRVVSVFDRSQTEPIDGKVDKSAATERETPIALHGESDITPALDRALAAYLVESGLTLESGDTGSANGWYAPATQTIRISDTLTGDQRLRTLVHEAAHFHAQHAAGINRADAETVAESAAFVVLRHFGIDAVDYSAPYIAGWAQDAAALRRNLQQIQATSRELIEAASAGLALAA